jgi:hypothetical protein
MGGPPPYGYSIKEGKLIENPNESKWIRKMYQWFSNGKSTQWIKTQLDMNGVPTRHKKGTWSLGSIQKNLRNTHYLGHYSYSDKKLGESVECFCPSIMKDTLWNSVQERKEKTKERKNQNNRTKRFYLLRNFMFCGHCGRPMFGRIKPSKNERVYYCPDKEKSWVKKPPSDDEKWVRGRGCEMTRSLNIPRTDELVWTNVMKVLSNSDVLKEIVKDVVGGEENPEKDFKTEKKKERRLIIDLLKVQETISKIETDHLLERMDKKLYRRVRKNLDEEKEKVKDHLRQTRLRMKEIGNQEKWMNSVSRFHSHLETIETKSEEDKKKFLSDFIDRIDVRYTQETKEHELTIKFKLPIVGDELHPDGDERMGNFEKKVILPPYQTIPQ